MSNAKHTPRLLRMLQASNCDSQAETIAMNLLKACKMLVEDLLHHDKDAAQFASVMEARAAIAGRKP